MPSAPQLSVIILNYKSEKFCHQCLLSLQKNPPSIPYEIILVDNASGDESIVNLQRVWSEALPIKFLELTENRGYAAGNNTGVSQAQGAYIAILNPDVSVSPGVLDELVSLLEANPRAGLVAPRLLSPDGSLQDSFRRFPTFLDLAVKRLPFLQRFFSERLRRFLLWDISLEKPSPVDWVVGACIVLKRQAWEEAGGFDQRYFLFLEDTDLCRTLWEKGWQVIFHPGYSVEHYHTRLSETGNPLDFFRKKTVRIHFQSALKYFWKWRGKKLPTQS